MKNLTLWTRASNYSGADFSDYFQGPAQHRDSNLLDQSNFVSALEMLGGESKTVIVQRCGHWAVGWTEQILVHKSDKKAVKKLSEILEFLEEYPILDESEFSERELQYQQDTFDIYAKEFIQNSINDLEKATDIPKNILECLKNSSAFHSLVHEIFLHRCGYVGTEEAFVSEGVFLQHLDDISSSLWADPDILMLQNQIKQALGVN